MTDYNENKKTSDKISDEDAIKRRNENIEHFKRALAEATHNKMPGLEEALNNLEI